MGAEAQSVLERHIKPGKESPLRTATAKQVYAVAEYLHKRFPRLTPNQVTVIGLASVLIGGKIIENENRKVKRKMINVVIGELLVQGGFLADAIDGPLSEIIQKETPGKHNSANGEIFDITADRLEEILLALLRAETARQKERRWGRNAAVASAITTTLPGIVKASRRAEGDVIAEVDTRNIAALLGERPSRVALNILATTFPRMQPLIDTIGAGANLVATVSRFRSDAKGKAGTEARKTAQHTKAVLSGLEAGAVICVATDFKKRR